MKHFLTSVLLVVLTATATALTIPFTPVRVNAICSTPDCLVDPSNLWAPYGPLSSKLQFKYYSNDGTELQAFENGQIDVYDSPVPKVKWATYDYNPDFRLGEAQGEFGMSQIDFNHESSDWTYWGCDFQNGNSPCGAEIRKAIAHLTDRPVFVQASILGGAAEALADPTPPVKIPSKSSLATQQSWDPAHPTLDAFNIAADPSGFATVGSPDFCAAADHMIAAGVATGKTAGTCVLTGVNPSVLSHPVRFMIRYDSPPRNAAGVGIKNALNALFGANVVAERFIDILQFTDIVFSTQPIDDWSMYTDSWSLPGPFADHLGFLYDSLAASNLCEGSRDDHPGNYGFICVPEFDTHANAASQTDDMPTFVSETLAALDEFGKRALTLPLYSETHRYLALRDVQGAVNAKGTGYPNFFTLLNGRDSPYVPVNPLYTFGGSSGLDTLRYGQKQGTIRLNVFHVATLWDARVLDVIYDTLVRTSPLEPEKIIPWMTNGYAIAVDAAGDTHIVFDLKSGLTFHDGHSLTAEDVKFSLINYRDFGCVLSGCPLGILKDVIIYNPLKLEVVLAGRGLSYTFRLAQPIIPKHLWDANNDGVVDAEKLDPDFDPLAAGILIGSGPFACRSIFPADLGRVGTGCGQNSDGSRTGQRIAPGGTMFLERFDFASPSAPNYQYMRSYNPSWPATDSGQFQEWSWADKDNNGVVDLVDLASVASCFGKTAPDSSCSAETFAYWDRLGTPNDITEEAFRVAARMDENYLGPQGWDSSYWVGLTPFTP